MFNDILTVCVGNVCRSPMAECILKEKLSGRDIRVSSAGLRALVGRPLDAKAKDVLGRHGYNGGNHKARQLEKQHIQQADIVLVMEKTHIEGVLVMAPEARGKVFLLGKWLGDLDVPDPFRQKQTMFDHIYTMIDEAVDTWMLRLG